MSKKLKAGLEFFIKKVEAMDDGTIFHMNAYATCVIGKSLNVNSWEEREILRKKFGIQRKEYKTYFGTKNIGGFLSHQQDVLRLFSGKVSSKDNKYAISKQDWLKLAYEQLNKM